MNGTETQSRSSTLSQRILLGMPAWSGMLFAAFLLIMVGKTIFLNKMLSIPNMSTEISDIFVAAGALLIASGWTWWLPKRWRPLALLLLNMVLTLLLYADLVYYRYFQDFITVPVLLQAFQVSALGDSIASLIVKKDLWFFADWIVLIPLTWVFGRALKHKRSYLQRNTSSYQTGSANRWKRWLPLMNGIAAIVIGIIMLIAPIQHATSTWAKGIFAGNWWNASIYNITGVFGFHGYDVKRYISDHLFADNALTQEEDQEISDWFEQHQSMLKGPEATFGKYKGSNVIIIQAEAFQNFVIGRSMNGQEITPNLNALLKDSLYFNRFFHQTGQGRTSDADFGVQASLHPLPTGSVFIRYPGHTYDALPSILKEHQYSTGAFHAYEAGFWNRYAMYEELGYDFFMSKKDYIIDEPLGWSLGDRSFFRQSIERITKEPSPFYSFMITLTSHHPYSLPEKVQELNIAPFEDSIFGDYLQSIRYVDAAMGELIQDLKDRGLWDHTILMFYGDHDNSINDHDALEQFMGESISDFEFRKIQGQVPLIIHLPDGAESGTVETVSGQLDIAPTLLHWLGIDPTLYYFMGSHLQAEGEHLVVQRNGSVTNGELYYVPSADKVYENGACYKYDTGEKGGILPCRPLYEEALKRLNISDLIIEKDAIPQLR